MKDPEGKVTKICGRCLIKLQVFAIEKKEKPTRRNSRINSEQKEDIFPDKI